MGPKIDEAGFTGLGFCGVQALGFISFYELRVWDSSGTIKSLPSPQLLSLCSTYTMREKHRSERSLKNRPV